MKLNTFAGAIFTIFLNHVGAQTLYFDTNGTAAGTSTGSSQNFTSSVWTTDSTGASSTVGYTPNSDIVFSAGTNGTGTQSVTINDAELVDGITINNGTVTLLGSGNPSLSIGAGGITTSSPDGSTTLDSSLGTVTLASNQSWKNNSAYALNANSGVSGSGQTLSFGGTGSGATVINGAINGTLNLTQNSATSALDLIGNSNNFSGTITANAGTVLLANFLSQNNTVNLNNGATLALDNTANYNQWQNNIVLGTGGGKFYAGNPATGGIDIFYGGQITGGTGLTLTGGDMLIAGGGADDVGTFDVQGGSRALIVGNSILSNNSAITVESGGVLDFQLNQTVFNSITLKSGAALESRQSGISIVNVTLPSEGTVTLGSDDVGQGYMQVVGNLALGAGGLTLDINGANGGTLVNLGENISGSGSLTINPGPAGGSFLVLSGANTYTGPTTVNYMNLQPGTQGFGGSKVTLNGSQVALTGGTLANNFVINNDSSGFVLGGYSDTTLSGNFELATASSFLYFADTGPTNLSVGGVTFDQVQNADRAANFDAYGTGAIYLTGTYSSPLETTGQRTDYNGPGTNNGGYGASSINFGAGNTPNGNYYLMPTADFSHLEAPNLDGSSNVDGKSALELLTGNLYIENSSFVPGQYLAVTGYPGVNHTVNVAGAQTVNLDVYVGLYNYGNNTFGSWTLGQSTADYSKWTGNIQINDAPLTISAVAGGRLEISGPLVGDSQSIVKTGAGTLVLSGANNYSTSSSTAFDIQQGTVLIENSANDGSGSSSAFGHNGGQIKIEAGATLGGTGFVNYGGASQSVVAMDKSAIIAPGEPGQPGAGIAPQFGTLTLAGGFTSAADGITMDFTLDSKGNEDVISTVGGTVTLTGTIKINITSADGGLKPDTETDFAGFPFAYTLIYGSGGNWFGSDPSPDFEFTVPDGYMVSGYTFSPAGEYLSVQFEATPEPSTYALLGLGLAGLVFIARRKKIMTP